MEYKGFDINFSLEGKIALVTGAASGIGRAIVEMYAQKGVSIIALDLLPKVHELTGELSGYDINVLTFAGDVSDKDFIRSVVSDSIQKMGRIDILVNCAGIAILDDAENLELEAWNKTLLINLTAPFMLAQSVGKEMIKSGGGKIINIASQAGIVALDKHVAYCASKAGIISMTKVMAMEWGEYNININAISPTVILTDLGKRAWAGQVGEDMIKKIPAGRFGYPEEVAGAAVFLASDAANLITGENLVIDGGYTIQ
ncbi:MAG: D-threitol dehydrogenase [Eubacteriales bacterium]